MLHHFTRPTARALAAQEGLSAFPIPAGALVVLAILTALLVSSVAMAQPKPGEGPPAEALAACKTAKASASCSFSSPQGTVSGSCQAPEGRPLACVPAGGKGPAGGSTSGAARP